MGIAAGGGGHYDVPSARAHPMKKRPVPEELSTVQQADLFHALETRFESNARRHPGLDWAEVRARLEANPVKLRCLHEMERTGGEPDVVGQDVGTGEYVFYDCSAESPAGRRSLCYDREGWEARKEARPENTAMDLAAAMGVELLTEDEYLALQKLGDFDEKTSSWLKTPPEIREQGGALFGDRRYGRVFVYQNSAPCYYRVRGFRGSLRV